MSEQIPDIITELRVLLWRGSRDIGARAEILAEVRDLRLHILSSPPDQDVDDIGRLAVLLESAGCPSEAESLLADAVTASSYRPLARATLLNHRGMLASLRGQPGEAAAFFEDALFTRGLDSLELVCRLQTNLASAYLRQGALGLAEKWALRALSVATTYRTAATEVAAAKVLWQAARQRADRAELDAAVTLLGRAVERRVAELDKNDPEALMLVVDLASAQLAVARSDGDSPRVEQLSEALALAAFRLSAVAGATDPRAIRAATTVALTQFDLAKDDGSAQRIEHSFHQLAALRKRAREVLPPDSPEVLSISLAAVGATVELARANGSHNGLKVSVSALRAATADVETALGPHAVQTLEASANLAIAELDVARALNSPDLVHQAIDQLTAVSQSIETSLGPDHPLLLVLTAASRLAHSLIADHDTDSERSTAAAGTAILVRASAAHWGMDREYLPFERAVSALRSGPASPTT
ncbi:MAG: hypothetical protein HOV87_32220, partial [Catenulispora sp.]|nr:hypothetical protein [Catenulispora sp.]